MDIQNPEKIEIEGLKTIHKLCKFGANHNMEGCSFTEIVERMFDELSKAQAVPESFILMPIECTDEIAEVIAFGTHVCGGVANDVYESIIKVVKEQK